MHWTKTFPIALAAAALLAAGPAPAKDDTARATAQARQELERARQEVEKARQELSRATRDLAKSLAKVERNNPKAQYFEYITDPKRAVLGIIIDDETAKPEDQGVRILAITPGGGAEKAGLKAGDTILAVNGKVLAADGRRPHHQLRDILRGVKAGDEVKLEIDRGGKRKAVGVVTQAPDEDLALAMPPMPMFDEELFEKSLLMPMVNFRGPAVRGLELARLDDDLAYYFKTRDGVLVVKAPKNGVLALKSGDVIQRIDGENVSEPITVLDKLHGRGDERHVKVEVTRQGRKVEVEGTVPAARGPKVHSKKRIVIDDDDVDVDIDDGDDDGDEPPPPPPPRRKPGA